MSASRKSWGAHSERWKATARRQGLSPARWNRWRSLPETTRRETDPRKYAAGESVVKQRHDRLVESALGKMKETFPQGRESTMRLGVEEMNNKQLKWTVDASPSDIESRAGHKPHGEARNPWWYR